MSFSDNTTDLSTPSTWTAQGASTATYPASGGPGGTHVIFAGYSDRAFISTGLGSLANTTTTFWFFFYAAGTLTFSVCDFFLGCNSTGAGVGIRLDGRGAGNVGASGFFTSTNFHTATTGSGPIINNPNLGGIGISGQTWHEIVVVVNGAGHASWSLDGTTIQSNVAISLEGDYLGVLGDYSSYGADFAAINVSTTPPVVSPSSITLVNQVWGFYPAVGDGVSGFGASWQALSIATAEAWTASSTTGLVVINPSSGSGNGTAIVTLSPSAVANLPRGYGNRIRTGSYTDTIVVNAGGTVYVPVVASFGYGDILDPQPNISHGMVIQAS